MYHGKNGQIKGLERASQDNLHIDNQKKVRTPRLDSFEMDDHYFLRISLPGVKKDNLEVYFGQEGYLEIKGKVVTIIPENFKKIISQEIYQGPFHRKIQLPNTVKKNDVNFSYENGILEIYISK
ncbi:HSP20 family protein [Salirhabdus euzebyi]|uniref:HSP20 family protein n=1 Tax=Salirhabdus euzebyi TaxID=394506 RepID=A0A841Q6G5_9BACI|nr:Hsp20/alpha crystallin family protein [Salirhabdus euzebyi]MBB6454010.1 HSP20 family protein [Salirhabdus euzebyi]